MQIGIDTSVVVRILAGEPQHLAMVALEFVLRNLRTGNRILVSNLVLAETYFAFQHHYGAAKADTLDALTNFVSSPGVDVSPGALEVLQTPGLATAKPGFVDRLILSEYRLAQAEQVATFEQSAARLPKVRVLKP
ncbi:MAG: PIN domain-containing protein [Acidobacteriota bacterium]